MIGKLLATTIKQDSKFAHLDKRQGLHMTTAMRLIQEGRPERVPFYSIDDIFILRNGYTPSKSNPDYWNGTDTVPWFRMEDIRKNGGILDHAIQSVSRTAIKGGAAFPANSLIVATSATIGAHALITVPYLSNQRFTSLILKPKFQKILDMKFVYYYGFILDKWCMKNTTTSSFSSVNMSKFRQFRFPIPPMLTQKTIVRILETSTSLEKELEKDLEKELELRQRQYIFYRDSVMSQLSINSKHVPLSEVARLIRGHGLTKKELTDSGMGAIHYGQIYTHFNTCTQSVISHVSPETASRLVKVNPGDVIVTNTSENVKDVGKAVAWLGNQTIVIGGHATVLRHRQNPEYIAYWFQTPEFQRQKIKFLTGTSVIDMNTKALANIKIPIPALDDQQRAVSMLNKFRYLFDDMRTSLPPEIKARREQYEYYRDQLLTFRELHV